MQEQLIKIFNVGHPSVAGKIKGGVNTRLQVPRVNNSPHVTRINDSDPREKIDPLRAWLKERHRRHHFFSFPLL